MKAFTFKGKEVYLASAVRELLEISPSTLYNYSTSSFNNSRNRKNSLIENEDFIKIQSISDKQLFLKENPNFDSIKEFNMMRLPGKFSLYYESALDKLISFRENTRDYGGKGHRRNKIQSFSDNQTFQEERVLESKGTVFDKTQVFQKKDIIDSANIDLGLVMNLLLKLDLENRQLIDKVKILENQIEEMSNLKELVHEYLMFKQVA